ncbi:hypothetical protein AB0873_30825 [Micromonospora sp. NPDC047707]|uniref:hypothetical protein n=1 Tax=Micromonospora sp. NPDC047707 TaxID=3154498 RepID=UPI003452F7D6
MKKFAEAKDDLYFQLAANFLFEPDMMAKWEDASDASTAAAVSWFRTRESLPTVLQQWRVAGARRVRDSRGRRPRILDAAIVPQRGEAGIRRRQEAESALRKGRRKKR